MLYRNEFELVCHVLKKRGVLVSELFADEGNIPRELILSGFYENALKTKDKAVSDGKQTGYLYRFKDGIGLCGILFFVPYSDGPSAVAVGPYFQEDRSESSLVRELERVGCHPRQRPVLLKYLLSVPVLGQGSDLFLMIDSLVERMAGVAEPAVIDIEAEGSGGIAQLDGIGWGEGLEGSSLHMKLIEKRYDFENELMRSVAAGHLQKVNSLISSLTEARFEMRTSDPLRNLKNYCIIMNTLLRKSAEQGGVHPVFIDKLSSDFAVRIEALTSGRACSQLMKEMYESYCRMVRKHSVGDYSPIVQRVVSMITVDLSADLAPHRLAEVSGVSLPYLSALFKREIGMTLSEFIREKRMKYACRLLEDGKLQVQSVALSVGIEDVQYFSKMFKAYTGKTPMEYRRAKGEGRS